MTRGKKHTRDEILKGIRKAWRDREDLRTGAVQKGPYRWMERSCHYYFDSWKHALASAGVSYEEVQLRVKEPKRLAYLEELCQAYADGDDLSATALQKKGNRSLYDRAKTYYKGRFFWENALADAGLPVEDIVRQRVWDKDKVKQRLRERRKQGKPLNASAVGAVEPDLYKAIVHHFDSYDEALEYAGFNPKKVRRTRPKYSKLEIVMKIIELDVKGKDLNESNILKGRSRKLKRYVYAAQKRFDNGWEEAVTAAGVDYSAYRKRKKRGFWSREKVLEIIREMHERGEPLNAGYTSKNQNALHHAALRRFGTWDNALSKAGVDPKKVRIKGPSLSKETIISEIRRMHSEGTDLSCTGIVSKPDGWKFYSMAWRRFGSWENAVTAAGLPYDTIRRVRGEYTLDELVEKVREFEKRGIDLNPTAVQRNPITHSIARAVSRRFDCWADFLDKAGIDKEPYCRVTNWRKGKQVLEYLRTNFEAGIVTGATRDRNFAAACQKYFGTIQHAAEAAGLVYSKSGKVTRKMLQDPKVLGALYRCNADFLTGIAKKVFFGAKYRHKNTLDISDLVHEAFIKLIEVLPKKPPKAGLRPFSYKRIYGALIALNKKFGKERLYGEEAYFDLFKHRK